MANSNNFLVLKPRKKDQNLEIRLSQSDEIQKLIDDAGLMIWARQNGEDIELDCLAMI